MTVKYYKKENFVCNECGKEWDTPGAAQSCYNKHRLMRVLEEVNNHKKLYIGDVIDDIEEKVEQGEYDYE